MSVLLESRIFEITTAKHSTENCRLFGELCLLFRVNIQMGEELAIRMILKLGEASAFIEVVHKARRSKQVRLLGSFWEQNFALVFMWRGQNHSTPMIQFCSFQMFLITPHVAGGVTEYSYRYMAKEK